MRHKTAAVACRTTARTFGNTWPLQEERQNIKLPLQATLESIQWDKNLHHNILCLEPLKIQWGEIKEYRTTKRWDHLLHESEQRKVEENPWIVAPPKSVKRFLVHCPLADAAPITPCKSTPQTHRSLRHTHYFSTTKAPPSTKHISQS